MPDVRRDTVAIVDDDDAVRDALQFLLDGIGRKTQTFASGAEFLQADDADAFSGAVLRLLADAGLRSRIATAARHLMEDRFSWARVARQFEATCRRAMERPG